MTTRTDIHRKSALVPEDYDHVLVFALPGGIDEPIGWNLKELAEMMKTKPFFRASRSTCNACGTHFRHGSVFVHRPTGEHIVVGHECAEKIEGHAMSENRRRQGLAGLERARKRAALRSLARELAPETRKALRLDHPIIRDIRGAAIRFQNLSCKQVDRGVFHPLPRRTNGRTEHQWRPVSIRGVWRRAHRVVYEAFRGPIPAGLVIDHLCRNRACVNPEHMEPVTQGENVRRGVSVFAINSRKTHCKRGHELTQENLIPDAGRRCRVRYPLGCPGAKVRPNMVKRATSGVRAAGSSAGSVMRRGRALSAGRDVHEPLTFYEFFCGGGMARAGLGPGWKCLFANDFDIKKSGVYAENWGSDSLRTADVRQLTVRDLPGCPVMAWASFPCQDLSLAGMGAGLRGDRSGTFWPFWDLMRKLKHDGRAPQVVVLENVCGTLTSHGGRDFGAIATALAGSGYRFGGVVIDAAEFVAQSRPRLFIIAALEELFVPASLVLEDGLSRNHTAAIRLAHSRLAEDVRKCWVWWNVPRSHQRAPRLESLIESDPVGVEWHSPAETRKLLGMMSPINHQKVAAAKAAGRCVVGTIYKRTRVNEAGEKVQRAEVRFDDVAGCLRTPAGGSSRQVILVVEGDRVRSRLLSSRECARLMGLPDTYKLPTNYNEAYHLTGDGVVVPVVRHIAANILEPLIAAQKRARGEL